MAIDYYHMTIIKDETIKPAATVDTPLIRRARDICLDAHQGQYDKAGEPYYLHPFHLAKRMTTESTICVAYLHDVIEDTHYTLGDLRNAGFTDEIIDAVACMTHDKTIPYMEYVLKIRLNQLARIVKRADLTHNSDTSRLPQLTSVDKRRLRKYSIAYSLLAEDPCIDGHYIKTIAIDCRHQLLIIYNETGLITHYIIMINGHSFVFTPDKLLDRFPHLSNSLSLYEYIFEDMFNQPEALITRLNYY